VEALAVVLDRLGHLQTEVLERQGRVMMGDTPTVEQAAVAAVVLGQ
jgi:hypothetical protein